MELTFKTILKVSPFHNGRQASFPTYPNDRYFMPFYGLENSVRRYVNLVFLSTIIHIQDKFWFSFFNLELFHYIFSYDNVSIL
jgi:hypothetical protein